MADAKDLLAVEIAIAGGYLPFGELTAEQVAARGRELAGGAGLGHGGRVAGVASAWKELGRVMALEGAATVAALDAGTIGRFAERLWIVPPGGSLL